MAKKSKTQRAKASAARAQRKAARAAAEKLTATDASLEEGVETDSVESSVQPNAATTTETQDKPKRSLFSRSRSADSTDTKDKKAAVAKSKAKAPAKKVKKHNRVVQFFIDVRAEMKRVTWPTRVDVLRWTGVVIVALLFFGIYVALLDNVIVTPLLFWISGL